MTQLDILRPEPEPLTVTPGDIFTLGRHRLMCGDATDKAQVAMLFAGQRPTLVVTSPPYAKQRDYDRPIPCWDSMMLGALDGHAFADDVQLLINLGNIHSKCEWVPYWTPWVQAMRSHAWRHFGLYVWDKLAGYPGKFPGRMTPSYEFILHLNKATVLINRIMPCTGRRKSLYTTGVRKVDGSVGGRKSSYVQDRKPSDSVIRLKPVLFGEHTGHPAQMPIALARHLISSYKTADSIIYEPFCGSGTTLLACEAEGVTGLGMEISPAYCTIAIDRWNKAHPDQLARRMT